MNLSFLGAAHEVTGSCYLLQACGKNILIDCGMRQGPDLYGGQAFPLHNMEIDCVLLTHAHIDHSGLLPLLYRSGYRGDIYATGATTDLCSIMLRDSAHIQMFEAEWRNRKGKRAGLSPYEPLYEMADALGAIGCFVPCRYEETISLFPGVTVQFTDAGHLLGSASLTIEIEENSISKKLVFSGDIGNNNQPLIRDPQYLTSADYVVMESTYGDRSHGIKPDYVTELSSIIQETFDRGGNVVVPSFAVGRTQELLYFIRKIKADGLIKGYPNFPVYVDSPLAIEATSIFHENSTEYYDEEAAALLEKHINPLAFPGLNTSVTAEESRNINTNDQRKIIISASGMCEAGRIKHHLKHNLWRRECTVLFVGYQAEGTLGRSILDGAQRVKLFGEEVQVAAEIRSLSGISAHADSEGLMRWISSFSPQPKHVFVTHGQSAVCDIFAARLQSELGLSASAPWPQTEFDLAQGITVREGIREKRSSSEKSQRKDGIYDRLLAAGDRLMSVIRKNQGGANKSLAQFTDQINSLSDKWER
ncbi:MAG: MBL fold metallo-hydrolase [Christensenella sp.]|nr:MBL fold metallo-hydrolase [Christensenella sp.]